MNTKAQPLMSRGVRIPLLTLAAVAMTTWTGCAAFHPIEATPVNAMPCSWRAKPRSGMKTIDLSLLRRERPPVHIVDAGDVLAVNIPGVFVSPEKDDPIPVHIPQEGDTSGPGPSVGFPVPVREDGSVSLPLAGSVHVRGMTVRQVEDLLRKKFIDELEILKEGRDRIIVNLLQARTHRILVIRQESAGGGQSAGQDSGRAGGGGGGGGGAQGTGSGSINIGSNKRGSGMIVNLPAYENDVLHALAKTAGLPGLDAENAVYVIRGGMGCSRLGGVVVPGSNLPIPEHTLPQHLGALDRRARALDRTYPPQPNALRGDTIIRGQSPSVTNASHVSSGGNKGKIQQVSVRNNFLKAFRGGNANEGSQLRPLASVNNSSFTPSSVTRNYSSDPVANQMAAFFGANEPGMGDVAAPSMASMPGVTQGAAMEHTTALPGIITEPVSQPMPQQQQAMPIPQYTNPVPVNQPLGTPAGYNSPFSIQGFGMFPNEYTVENPRIRRIPIRLSGGEVPEINCEDVTLEDGDILFIESRDSEVYYTGGLLGGGQYTLPRDYDIDIIEAISIAQATSQQQGLQSNLGGPSVLNQDVTVGASEAVILRKLPTGGQARIKVNLYRAMRNPKERVLIQPGDFIILQYSRVEAYMAFFERRVLEGQLLGFGSGLLLGNNN